MLFATEITKWVFKRNHKTETLVLMLTHFTAYVNKLLLEMKQNKDYEKLQMVEEALRSALLKTLETKGEVAVALMKKDFEMNKDLIAKIQEQAQQEQPKNHPRFGLN